jgi:hypothetical protein
LYKETTNDQYFKLNYSPFSSFNSSLITSNNISNFIPNGYSSNINSTYARFNDDQSFLIYTWDQGAEEAVELTTTDTPKLLFDTANIFNLAQGTLTLHDNQIFDWSIHQSESDSIKLSFSVLLAETTAQGQIQSYVSQRSDARHPYFVKDPYTSSTYYEKSFYSTGCNITNVNLLDLSFNDNPSNPITIDFSSGYTLGEAIEYRMTPPDGNGHYTICARLKDDIHLTIKKGNDVLKNVVFSSGDNNVYVKTY